jgi:acetyl-CoA C-acetyltransferase
MNLRNGTKFGPATMIDGMDGLVDATTTTQWAFVLTYVLLKYNFSREDQDKYAIQSYERSAKAKVTIMPVAVPQRKGDPIIVSKDEDSLMSK